MSVSLLTYDKDMCPFLGTLYNFINLHCISLYRDTLYLYFSNSNPLKTTLKDRFRSNITSGDLEFSALQEEADYNRASNMINYMQELHMQLEPSFCAALYIQLYIRCSKAGATSTMGKCLGYTAHDIWIKGTLVFLLPLRRRGDTILFFRNSKSVFCLVKNVQNLEGKENVEVFLEEMWKPF